MKRVVQSSVSEYSFLIVKDRICLYVTNYDHFYDKANVYWAQNNILCGIIEKKTQLLSNDHREKTRHNITLIFMQQIV